MITASVIQSIKLIITIMNIDMQKGHSNVLTNDHATLNWFGIAKKDDL